MTVRGHFVEFILFWRLEGDLRIRKYAERQTFARCPVLTGLRAVLVGFMCQSLQDKFTAVRRLPSFGLEGQAWSVDGNLSGM